MTDPLGPCVYCGAPWHLQSLAIIHKDDCPMVTGLYPVLQQDLPRTGEGMCCMACGGPFEVGDMSCRRNLEGNWSDIVIVICMSCALLARTN